MGDSASAEPPIQPVPICGGVCLCQFSLPLERELLRRPEPRVLTRRPLSWASFSSSSRRLSTTSVWVRAKGPSTCKASSRLRDPRSLPSGHPGPPPSTHLGQLQGALVPDLVVRQRQGQQGPVEAQALHGGRSHLRPASTGSPPSLPAAGPQWESQPAKRSPGALSQRPHSRWRGGWPRCL